MPGTFVFRPIEANINSDIKNTNLQNLEPICKVKYGNQKKTTISSIGNGSHPHWDEDLILEEGKKHNCKVVLKDVNQDRKIGKIKLDLSEVEKTGKVDKWFDIRKGDKVQGQLHLEIQHRPGTFKHTNSQLGTHGHFTNRHQPRVEFAPLAVNQEKEQAREHLPYNVRLQTGNPEYENHINMSNTMISNPNTVGLDTTYLQKSSHGLDETIEHEHNFTKYMKHHTYPTEKVHGSGEVKFREREEILAHSGKEGISDPNSAKFGINHENFPVYVTKEEDRRAIIENLPPTTTKPVYKDYDTNHLKLSDITSYKQAYGAGNPPLRSHPSPYIRPATHPWK